LSGSGTVITWADPSGKTPGELDLIAKAHEGKIPFSSAKYFRDRIWQKYEDVLVENLGSATIYTIDCAYNSARQAFDFVDAPLPQGATRIKPTVFFVEGGVGLLRGHSARLLERLTDAEERKQLELRIQKMTSMLESQRKVVQ
jgi:hypothetical protein